jgi:hypothetical protein
VSNLVRRVLLAAAQRQDVAPDRSSFVDALRWLREARRGAAMPRLKVNPLRPDRVEPRACKRRPKSYKFMTEPRTRLRSQLLHNSAPPKEDAA